MTKTKEEIIATIKKEIPFVDIKPYSHNIISLQLTMLEEVAGEEAVVELVKSTKLKDLGWGYMIKNIQWCNRCKTQHKMPRCEFIALPVSEGGHIPDGFYN